MIRLRRDPSGLKEGGNRGLICWRARRSSCCLRIRVFIGYIDGYIFHSCTRDCTNHITSGLVSPLPLLSSPRSSAPSRTRRSSALTSSLFFLSNSCSPNSLRLPRFPPSRRISPISPVSPLLLPHPDPQVSLHRIVLRGQLLEYLHSRQ